MTKYVAYYRVSTDKQGLGLDAQKMACDAFIASSCSELLAEFSEKESGKNDTRAELHRAIELCKKEGAVLLVAKLDRLTRSVEYGFRLCREGLSLRALDCPDFGDNGSLLLSVTLGLAQQERELISKRTRAALQALKAKGVVLGTPENLTDEARKKGNESHMTNARKNTANVQAYALASALLQAGGSNVSAICRKLNEAGYKTPRGCCWTAAGVTRLIKMYAQD